MKQWGSAFLLSMHTKLATRRDMALVKAGATGTAVARL